MTTTNQYIDQLAMPAEAVREMAPAVPDDQVRAIWR
jgi:hypothetical protein